MVDSPELAEAINALLKDDGAHMRMAPRRAEAPTDAFRAKRIALDARDALSKYRDVRVAEADGYEKFLPFIENQSVYHYNNIENVGMTMTRFDATRPASLLYKKDAKADAVTIEGVGVHESRAWRFSATCASRLAWDGVVTTLERVAALPREPMTAATGKP